MSVARIRTPDDPLDAAWNYKGHTYVGFGECQDIHGGTFPDQHCEQCTTLDRTPASLDEDIKKAGFPGALWPDEDDKDAEWLPEDDSDARSEVLEYDTEADSDVESLGISQCDNKDAGDGGNALRELHAPLHRRGIFHTVHCATATCMPESRLGRNTLEVFYKSKPADRIGSR
jgi:hypothetical protein